MSDIAAAIELPVIIELNKVVDPYLGGSKLYSYTRRSLTNPGDNYGSILLAIDAKIQTVNGSIEELELVAKIPPAEEELWRMFQPDNTCRRENAVYSILGPAMRRLQIEYGAKDADIFDGFARYYGSRISLARNAPKVDDNAVLVMENLNKSGFRDPARRKMFDHQHAKLILIMIGKFHALPIALRVKKSDDFNKRIRPHFNRLKLINAMGEEERKKFERALLADVAVATANDQAILERVQELMDDYKTLLRSGEREDNLYTTIIHFDMWINNFMIKYDDENIPCAVKIVDFQMTEYESLVLDVVFFLFSSVETEVLDCHTNELLLFYYYSFLKSLDSVKMPTKEYSFEGFMQELHKYAPIAICISLIMNRIILGNDCAKANSRKMPNPAMIQRTADIIRLAQKFSFFYK